MKILSKLVQTYWKLDIKLFPLCDVLQEIYDEAEVLSKILQNLQENAWARASSFSIQLLTCNFI